MWTLTANWGNKKLVLHMRLRCGSLSITIPVSLLANEFNVLSVLHGQVSLAAVNQIYVISWGYQWLHIKGLLWKCKYNHMKCTKYEIYAFLHRFHILHISRNCSSKIELSNAFEEVNLFKHVVSLFLLVLQKSIWILTAQFKQGSYGEVWAKFKDFSRTSQD